MVDAGRARWVLAAAVLAALAFSTTARAAAPAGETSAVTGTAPREQASALAPQGPTPAFPRGARRIPPLGTGQASASAPASAPQAAASPLAAAPESLLANFNGVSSRDSAVTNFGQQFEPPDQGLCAGNGFVVEMVNSAYKVYRPDGTVVSGPFNVNGPFNEGLTEFTSDPRCHYDAATHTWFATILFINRESTRSHLDIAVNTSGDPTTVWTDYRIDTSGLGGASGQRHPGCPCFGDQPRLGIDAVNLYVTTDEFSILGPEFYGPQIYAVAKKDLVSLASSVHFVHFNNLTSGGTVPLAMQPAISTTSSSAEYFLNSLDPNKTFDNRIGVWAMTNRGAVAAGGTPTLSSVVIPSETYGLPVPAEQRGSVSTLDAGDDRMQQTQFVGGTVWGELDTSVTIPGDSQARDGAAWFAVHPTLRGGALAKARITRQGYVAVSGNYLLYPALELTRSGKGAMVVSLAGATRFPSAAFAALEPGAGAFGPVTVAAPGSTHYDPNAERWGDYSWAVADPSGESVWLATEYMPPKASRTENGERDWGTRVLDVG